jgi:small-conductance mechanosensitive channel
VILTLVAIAAGLALLPPAERKRLRVPAFFFLAYFLLAGLNALFGHRVPEKPIRAASIFFLWAAAAHASAIAFLDGLLARRLNLPIPRIFRDILQVALYFVVLLATARTAGVELSSLLAGSALITAVIGLSLQDTLGNVFAGLSIQAQRPFEVGDFITLADSSEPLGKVIEINWRATKILTNDGIEVIVPNGVLAKTSIRNLSKPQPWVRRSIRVHAAYEFSPAHVRETLLKAIVEAPGVRTDMPASVIIDEFDPDGASYRLRYFADIDEHIHTKDSVVRERIWYAFRRAGIDIPYAQRDVHLYTREVDDKATVRATHVARRLADLRRVDILDVLDDEMLQALAEKVSTRRYAVGERILKQGDEGDQLFIVEHGEVAVVLEPENAAPIELARLGKGKFFGEMSLMTGARRTASVRATRECAVLVVGKSEFQETLHRAPELAEKISAILATRQAQLATTHTGAGHAANVTSQTTVILGKIREFFGLRG